jgi:IS5 family transposase
LKLRQSFVRTVPKLLVAQRGRGAEEERREHARWLGALRRSPGGDEETACRITPGKLGPAQGGNGQENPEPKALDSGKIYSLHEPQVYCVFKGQAHEKYEFGARKASVMGRVRTAA